MNQFKLDAFKITEQALNIWQLSKGAEVLDIGCGEGKTVAYLQREYGYKALGIDLSRDIIKQGLKRNPDLNIKYGDGEFLDGFLSYSFDGVMMEGVLSLVGLPDEALHEAYCVLKKGGKLYISDFYIKDPDPELLKTVELEVEKNRNTLHHHDHQGGCGTEHKQDGGSEDMRERQGCFDSSDCSDCGECEKEHEHHHENVDIEEPRYRAVNFRSSGRFLINPLLKQLEEIGYANIAWEDCSTLYDEAATKALKEDTKDQYKTGYFALTAEKP